jgi:hypothetical protein
LEENEKEFKTPDRIGHNFINILINDERANVFKFDFLRISPPGLQISEGRIHSFIHTF